MNLIGTQTSHRSRIAFALALTGTCGLALVIAHVSLANVTGEETPHPIVQTLSEHANSSVAAGSCIQCHRFEVGQTHPVDVQPSMNTGLMLPLQQGKMTCQTCHDAGKAHVVTQAKVGIRSTSTASLCMECHKESSPGTKAVHSLVYGKAHSTSGKTGEREVTGGLDSESRNCLSCHDGTAAEVNKVHAIQMQGMDASAESEHPVGVPMKATNHSRSGDFRVAPAATLDRRIRLSQGNIACASCHNVYSREPAKLVMSNQGSKLCLSCHIQ